MAGDVVNIKVCSPLKLRNSLTGNYHAICHYSYNLPLCVMLKRLMKPYAMKIKIIILAIIFLFNKTGSCQSPDDIEGIFNNIRSWVVSIGTITTDSVLENNKYITIKRYNSIGSGLMTYVKKDESIINCVVTAGHVIKYFKDNKLDSIYIRPSWADTMKITEYYGISIPVLNTDKTPNTFLYPENHIDLGSIIILPNFFNEEFIRVAREHSNRMFPIQSIKPPYVGSEVWICGYPGHLESEFQNKFLYSILTFKPGHITWRPSENLNNKDLDHITIVESNATFGNSGGPVFTIFTKHVELVGILVGGYSEYNSVFLNGKPVLNNSTKQPLVAKTRAGVSIIEKGEYVNKLLQYIESEIKQK